MSAAIAAVVGGSALALGATTGVALAAAGAGAAIGMSGARSDAKAAQASQERAAAGLASSSDYAAKLADEQARERLAFEREQYEEFAPLARRVSESQIAAQEEQMRQARDYYDYMTGTFRPVEQGLVQRAQEFDTEAYREQLASQAAADAARAFGATQAQTSRGLARMGVAPGSGAAQAQMNQNAIALASQRAGAMTGTRQQAEQMGYARLLDAAGLGRNLPGASTAAYGAATQAGSAGLQSAMLPGAQMGAAMGSAAGTMLAGTGQRIQGLGALYSGQTSLARGAMDNLYGMQGALAGTAGTLGAAYIGR
jgi:hypothetical protein